MADTIESLLSTCTGPSADFVLESAHLSIEDAEQLKELLAEKKFEARILDAGKLNSQEDAFLALSKTFAFPGYFGHNWDAVLDCLSDLSWLPPAKGYVCILLNDDAWQEEDGKTRDTFLRVFQDAAERWNDHSGDTPFKVICCGGGGEQDSCASEAKVGTIGWMDLTVDDAPKVRDFYQQVTGWTTEPVDMGDYQDYCMKSAAGDTVAGVCHARGANAGLPPQWLIYIIVEDLQKSLATCESLGGEVLQRREEAGFAVIRDPAGAVAALYQAAK